MSIEFDKVYVGKISEFGGPSDRGVSPSEGLALFNQASERPEIFLPEQPPKINNDKVQEGVGLTTGLARRLDPSKFYCAMFWDYDKTPKKVLLNSTVRITNIENGKHCYAIPCDKGPALWTGRLIDASEGVLKYLGVTTDQSVKACLTMNKVV